MKKAAIFFLILCLSLTKVKAQENHETFTFGTNTNPEGVTLMVDGQGFIIGGEHVLPVMGEIHYLRVPEKDWRREIRKMKAGGITILATYAFWIYHEPEEGQWDWSGNKNLRAFLQICKEENMMVVLRIGPFCHGEVYLGGFPLWLAEKAAADQKNFKLRSTAPGFIAAATSLYQHLGEQAKGMLWKDGGPIVGIQIENECRGSWHYLMTLRETAIEAGFDVPFMTRTGWPKLNDKEEFGKLLPLYGDYADGFWDRGTAEMPGNYPKAFEMKETRLSDVIATESLGKNQDTKMEKKDLSYPYLTCELGGGMMTSYHRRINISGDEAFPLAICKLGSGSNLPGYYMYHGGTNAYNPNHSMAECQASLTTNYNDMPHMTYDFQSPLGEMGQMNRASFNQTRWLHQFLADWGTELAVADVDTLSIHYARRGPFVFRNDYVRILNENGRASVTLQDWKWENLTISTTTLQPFAKADGGLYFITVKGEAEHYVTVNGKNYSLTVDKPQSIEGRCFTCLSPETAEAAYVIDGKMHFAKYSGKKDQLSSPPILISTQDGVQQETWIYLNKKVKAVLTKQSQLPRTLTIGSHSEPEQPCDADFNNAPTYIIQLPRIKESEIDNMFLEINYKGDVARVYADGVLVEDNFWNGKPMLVRISDLAGKTTQINNVFETAEGEIVTKNIELKILPMGKDYPIYLQKDQKAFLEAAPDSGLLSLDNIRILYRQDTMLR